MKPSDFNKNKLFKVSHFEGVPNFIGRGCLKNKYIFMKNKTILLIGANNIFAHNLIKTLLLEGAFVVSILEKNLSQKFIDHDNFTFIECSSMNYDDLVSSIEDIPSIDYFINFLEFAKFESFLETDNRSIVSLIQRNLIRTISAMPVILEKINPEGKIINVYFKEEEYVSKAINSFWHSFLDNLQDDYPNLHFAKFSLSDFDDPDLFLELINSFKTNISLSL